MALELLNLGLTHSAIFLAPVVVRRIADTDRTAGRRNTSARCQTKLNLEVSPTRP